MFHLDRIQQRLFIVMGAIIIILASILLYSFYFSGDEEAPVLKETEAPQEVAETPSPPQEEDKGAIKTIKIYITGAIMHPGVIELTEGERLTDAVNAAGGVTADADLTKVNLAIKVRDEGMYYIPSVGEDIQAIVEVPPIDTRDENNSENGKININTASQSMLETLPSIGPARAKSIIKYREDNGGFKTNEDIMNVSGIATKIYESLKDFICVE